ncbi:MAG: chloride channel protein [Xanthobacteraceae bacterium]|nr:chloride channel protein [Xanthobacteraceae bacterium]
MAVSARLSAEGVISNKTVRRIGAAIRSAVRSNEFFLIPVALAIGILSGAAVTAMSAVAQLAHVVIYGIAIDIRLSASDVVHPVVAILAPAAGGLILGLMEWWRRRLKLSNATDPIEANALRGGRLSLRDSVVVSGQTVISNGAGASVGLEAGYTQIGAGLASLLGRMLNLRRNDLRIMVGCGAAAAISAAFDAPLTGAFYACELIVGVYSLSSAAPILTASITAALTARQLGGAPYSLTIPHVSASSVRQYLVLIALGLVTAVIGIAIMRAVPWFERLFRVFPVWIRPVAGGVCVGAMAIVTPQVLAAGHGAMLLDFSREMAGSLILTIVILKIMACLISLSSGFRGGLFFASLFVGSLIGKLFSVVMSYPLFGLIVDPTASALTAMACLGVAIVGGPLTMSFLVLEMTGSLEVTAVILAACIATSVFVRAVFGHSFSTWRLHLRGETIRSANDVGWLRNLTVQRLMRFDPVLVRSNMTIQACRREHPLGSCQAAFLVTADNKYCGVVLLADLFSSDFDIAADTEPVSRLAKYRDTSLSPEMNIKIAMTVFDRAEAEILAVTGADDVVTGYLNESFARRRYAEELDQVAASVLGL